MKLEELGIEIDMQERSGVKVSDVKMESPGFNKLFIALENAAEKIVGWCNGVIDATGKVWRCPIYLLNGKPYPHLMADGDYIC